MSTRLAVPCAIQRHVRDHLVINMVVALGQLHDTIQNQYAAKSRFSNMRHPGTWFAPRYSIGVHGENLRVVLVQLFLKCFHGITPRLCSDTVSIRGLKACLSTSIALCGSASPHMNTSMAA